MLTLQVQPPAVYNLEPTRLSPPASAAPPLAAISGAPQVLATASPAHLQANFGLKLGGKSASGSSKTSEAPSIGEAADKLVAELVKALEEMAKAQKKSGFVVNPDKTQSSAGQVSLVQALQGGQLILKLVEVLGKHTIPFDKAKETINKPVEEVGDLKGDEKTFYIEVLKASQQALKESTSKDSKTATLGQEVIEATLKTIDSDKKEKKEASPAEANA